LHNAHSATEQLALPPLLQRAILKIQNVLLPSGRAPVKNDFFLLRVRGTDGLCSEVRQKHAINGPFVGQQHGLTSIISSLWPHNIATLSIKDHNDASISARMASLPSH
jgi:hypothetical protein